MNILIAARHPPGGRLKIGGVQSWCQTVGDEMTRRGHDVTYWGPGEVLNGFFDIGIFANVADTGPVMQFCRKTVSVCHGIIEPEKPPLRNAAFTSEEVRDHWHGEGPVIRQPVDLDFWRPGSGEKRYLVRFSYRDGLEFVPYIATRMGLHYVHLKDSSPEACRKIIDQAACVLATGRAAVEAMAMGAPVVICDDRGYQEPLLDPDTSGSMTRNYSGRGGITPVVHVLRREIDKAIERGSLRGHVKDHHDVRDIADQLLEVAG